MAFIPRMHEVVRVQEVLEQAPPDVFAAARNALGMAWGVALMRTLWVARVQDRFCGPYATQADAAKAPGCEGATAPLQGLGAALHAREGGPWIDWCLCGHRNGDHQVDGPRKMRCLWSTCECVRHRKVEAKTLGAGWRPVWQTNPTLPELEAGVRVLSTAHATPTDMAKSVLREGWQLLQQWGAERNTSVLADGRVLVGPVRGYLPDELTPWTPAGAWQAHPLHPAPVKTKKGSK